MRSHFYVTVYVFDTNFEVLRIPAVEKFYVKQFEVILYKVLDCGM